MTPPRLYLPAGSASDGADPVVITPESAGWEFTGLRVVELSPGESRTLTTGAMEMAVLPLAGSCEVKCLGQRFELTGRRDVFSGVSDFAYLPLDSEARISSARGGRFALPAAKATRRLDARYGPAEEVPVEVRGAGRASRQINNFLEPDAFPADKLMAVEVLTPEGNWSSYPPHKHDEQRPDEAEIEEIYFFEIGHRSAGGGWGMGEGFGLHRLYTADGDIDLTEEVRHGDVVLIPRGYHGPSAAAPGYDMYYLNVLAGPDPRRSMAFRDDPRHAWVRDGWEDTDRDVRLPLCEADRREG